MGNITNQMSNQKTTCGFLIAHFKRYASRDKGV